MNHAERVAWLLIKPTINAAVAFGIAGWILYTAARGALSTASKRRRGDPPCARAQATTKHLIWN